MRAQGKQAQLLVAAMRLCEHWYITCALAAPKTALSALHKCKYFDRFREAPLRAASVGPAGNQENHVLIQVNRDNQITDGEATPGGIENIARARLSRVLARVSTVELHIGHVKQSSTNNPGYRCSVELRPEGMGVVAASAEGPGVEAVTRSACDKVLHAYDRAIGKKDPRARN